MGPDRLPALLQQLQMLLILSWHPLFYPEYSRVLGCGYLCFSVLSHICNTFVFLEKYI